MRQDPPCLRQRRKRGQSCLTFVAKNLSAASLPSGQSSNEAEGRIQSLADMMGDRQVDWLIRRRNRRMPRVTTHAHGPCPLPWDRPPKLRLPRLDP